MLRTVPGNDVCADCSTRNPDWCSLNLGIMICMEVRPSHIDACICAHARINKLRHPCGPDK
jgi:hypothetical protein